MDFLRSALTYGLISTAMALPADPVVVPRVEDPSPIIDGDLNDWADRGALLTIDRPEQVTYGKAAWQGVVDLSGWVRLGHGSRHLYVAGHVADSVVAQSSSGRAVWRGDHVILFLDFVQSGRWEDMLQLGLSPGGLAAQSGAERVGPELVIWRPEGLSPEGAAVAARRTAGGYDVEAAIPWRTLRVQPVRFQTLAFDVAFSDCDQTPDRQETCMSFSVAPWDTRNPNRLMRVGLGDRAGLFPADAFDEKRIEIAKEELVVEPTSQREFAIDLDAIHESLVPTLTFKARAVWPRAGGCIAGLYIDVNGKPIPRQSLAERPKSMEFVGGGQSASWARGITLFYSPDFDAIERSGYKPIGFRACEYVVRLDGMLRTGENTITFKNNLHYSWAAKRIQIAVADIVLSWRTPSQFRPPKIWKPAPRGPLPTFEPRTVHRVAYAAKLLPGGAVEVSWHGQRLTVSSRFSRSGGKWAELGDQTAVGWDSCRRAEATVRAQASALGVERSLVLHDEAILVRDTLRNTSSEVVPVMITHEADPGALELLYICGRPVRGEAGANSVAENPSVVVLAEDHGFGLMAHADVFRIHCRSAGDSKRATLTDNSLALRPGVTYRHEWLIVPLAEPDYWAFVNAVRRFFGNNFTIPGSFAFFPAPHTKYMKLPLDEIGRFIDRKAARFVAITTGNNYKGIFAHGPVKRDCETEIHLPTIQMLRKVRPRSKILVYFNCFDCARTKDDPVRWPDCQVLRPDGKNIRAGTTYPVYFPTLSNAYGREMDRSVDWVLNTLRVDGVWWDMFNGYGTHYGEPWDGWSADIDARTHILTRRKASAALLTWEWRRRTLERFLREGGAVAANGCPMMTSEYAYRVPRVTETASVSNLSRSHLFTPIALGDHITEHNEADCYLHMLKALDWGGLYYWYSSHNRPTRPTLTSYMFPFTPVELHEGYLIGEERILTCRSGLFGWGDTSDFDVHVFDRVGRETLDVLTPRVVRGGKVYAEVRLPEGYSAAVVRK